MIIQCNIHHFSFFTQSHENILFQLFYESRELSEGYKLNRLSLAITLQFDQSGHFCYIKIIKLL